MAFFRSYIQANRAMTIQAPFDRYRGKVKPDWIDINGHMNLAYYTMLFAYATDMLFDAIGIGADYKRLTNHGTFVVETHNIYERELLAGEEVRVLSHILGADAKRLHLAHEMFRLADEQRSAMQELIFLSIDLTLRRVVPFPVAAQICVATAAAAHAHLPAPDWAGRRIAPSGVGAQATRARNPAP